MKKVRTLDAKILGFTAVAAIIGAGFASAVGVSAYQDGMGFRGNFDAENRDALRSALESGNYTAWSELVTTRDVSEDRFNEMVERHTEQLDRHEVIEKVLEENDFEAWSDFIAESDDWGRGRIAEVVTEENFSTFVAMHEAMEAGDANLAKELREELGLGIRAQDGQGFQNKSAGMRQGGMGGACQGQGR